MVELADTIVLGAIAYGVRVRTPLSTPKKIMLDN